MSTIFLPKPGRDIEIIALAALILFLGVPHGALDVLYLRKIFQLQSSVKIALVLLVYVAVAVGVVCLWLISPFVFLVGFLIASGFHFSGDPDEGSTVLTRVVVGAGVIALPSLLHASELKHLYSLLTSAGAAETVIGASIPIAFMILGLSIIGSGLETLRGRYLNALELIAVVVLATVAPPLISFTTYFCLMHSARHIVRTERLVGMTSRSFLRECALPMVAVCIIMAVGWIRRGSVAVDASIIPLLFVTLAALTAPHLLIVEPVRWRGWQLHSFPALHNETES